MTLTDPGRRASTDARHPVAVDVRRQAVDMCASGTSRGAVARALGIRVRDVDSAVETLAPELVRRYSNHVDRTAVASLRRTGMTNDRIADSLGCSVSSVVRVAMIMDPSSSRRPPRVNRDRVLAMHAEGETPRQIAAALGCAPSTVSSILRANGVEPHHPARRVRQVVDADAAAAALADGADVRELAASLGCSTKTLVRIVADDHPDVARAARASLRGGRL